MVNWKKITLISCNVLVAAYLTLAMMAFNKPDEEALCKDVRIDIEDGIVPGFLTRDEVKQMLVAEHISPVGKRMVEVNLRLIEETLQGKDLIEQAECYKAQDNVVNIHIRQRIPVIRVISNLGDDYYVDSHGRPLPHTEYSRNLIVATGDISRHYAAKVLAPMANLVLSDPFWKNQTVQLNVLRDGSVELVPRVGDHIAYLGQPVGVTKKLERLRKFYRYGLNEAGWNKYSVISVEFDNQIICKKRKINKKIYGNRS